MLWEKWWVLQDSNGTALWACCDQLSLYLPLIEEPMRLRDSFRSELADNADHAVRDALSETFSKRRENLSIPQPIAAPGRKGE